MSGQLKKSNARTLVSHSYSKRMAACVGTNYTSLAQIYIVRKRFAALVVILLMDMASLKFCSVNAEDIPSANAPLYTGIITQLQEAEFDYQGQARSERDLETCISDGHEKAVICSVVQQRFWQPPLVHRLCRCPDRQECPWRWSPPLNSVNLTTATMSVDQDIDGEPPGTLKSIIHTRDRTMSLNNRSQLKFCQNVRRMPICSPKTTAIRIRSRSTPENLLTLPRVLGPKLYINNNSSIHVTATCKCPQARYWRYQKTILNVNSNETAGIIDSYACVPLKRCRPMEFCGHICADNFSSYYQCSCPKGHLCLTQQPRLPINVSELLFTGTAYKGICTPIPT